MQSDWFGTLTPREAATLGLVEKLYGENVVVDVTQDLAFGGRVTDDSRCNTVLPGTTYWVGGDINRVVIGYEPSEAPGMAAADFSRYHGPC